MSGQQGRYLAWALVLLFGGLFSHSFLQLATQRRAVEEEARAEGRAQARAAASSVQALLQGDQSLVHGLVVELEAGRAAPRALEAPLRAALDRAHPSASRMGVLFQPFAGDPARRLFAPYAERRAGRAQRFAYQGAGDYTLLPWYRLDLGQAGWNEPHADPATGDLLVDYSEPFRRPGAAAVSGVVRLEVTMKAIQELVGALAPGRSGYGFLLSRKGVYLADPLDSRVRKGETFAAVARELGDPGRLTLVPALQAHRAGSATSVSAVTGQETWIFLEPVPASGWSLGLMIIQEELVLAPPGLARTLVALVVLAVAGSLAGLYLLLRLWRPATRKLWALAGAGSLLITAGTCSLWHLAYRLHQAPGAHEVEVMSRAAREAFLKHNATLGQGFREVAPTCVPTGIFIQQMDLSGDMQMKLSGQVWQKFPKGLDPGEQGITFPEAVSSELGPGTSRQEGDTLVHIYPFRGVFRMETGSTVTYPFDRSSVRIRIWPRRLYSSTMLVPDLEAYTLLVPVTLPGLDRGLSLAGWQLVQSHFSFLVQSYNMNLGIADFTGQQGNPELVFTFTLRRNFINPFIATFLPILVVVGLLFTILLTTCHTRERIALTGFSVINVLRSIISLFFPVVVSQINLRNHILTEGLLYVEYYYFTIYCMILLVGVNALAVAFLDLPLLQREDNLIAKLLFWPVLSLAFFGISTLYLL